MAKRMKIIEAGQLRRVVLYTAPEPRDGPRERAQKSRATARAQQFANDKQAVTRLKFLMAANFGRNDLFVTLTFRPGDQPESREKTRNCFRRFIRDFRGYRSKRGQPLKYIYVIEGKHGAGLYHVHMVVNATGSDIETIRSLWTYGDQVEIEYIKNRGYETLSRYMTKERWEGRRVGSQLWSGSKNLRPPVTRSKYVPNETTLEPPLNCHILLKYEERQEFGYYCAYEYYVPEPWELSNKWNI